MKKPNEQEVRSKVVGQRFDHTLPLERAAGADIQDRTLPIAITSDKPILHWFGYLKLNHSPECIRLTRLQSGAPLLLEHTRSQKIGGLLEVETDGHVLRAKARFSRRAEADAELLDIEDGIGRGISGGFALHHIKLVEQRDDDYDVYQSDDWEPIEASLVSIPADISVGVGRALADLQRTDDTDDNDDNPANTAPAEDCSTVEAAPTGEDERARPASPSASTTPLEVRSLTMDREQELLRIGEMFGETEMARDFILTEKSPAELRAAIFQKRTTTQAPTPKPPVELTPREAKQYSLTRAIQLQLARQEGRGDVSGFEREVSDEIERKVPAGIEKRGGIFVPTLQKREVLERAGLEAKTANLGGNSVFTEYGGFLDALRNSTKVMQLGATMLPGLQGNVSFVKQATDSVAYWVGENTGSDVTASDLTLGLVTLSPKTMMARSAHSRQLLNQSVLAVDALVQNSLVQAHAIKLDNSAIHADGSSNAITGIYSQSGVNAVAFGGNPTYDKVVDMETAVQDANAAIGTMGYLSTIGVKGKAKKTLEFAVNGAEKLWKGGADNAEMNGYRAEASTNLLKNMGVGTNEHAMVFGVWSAILFGEWGAMELLTDPFTLAGQAMIRIISFMMVDLQLKYGPCFAKGTGLIVT